MNNVIICRRMCNNPDEGGFRFEEYQGGHVARAQCVRDRRWREIL